MRAGLAAAALVALAAGPAGADCRLALALGLDVSRSVSPEEHALQRLGLAAALDSRDVKAALLEPGDPVALAVFEWSGIEHQEQVLSWTLIRSEADLKAVIDVITGHPRRNLRQFTALGAALDYGRQLLAAAPACAAMTLDVSGDGRSNQGLSPGQVYSRIDFDGITVNGLAIGGHESDIADYYAAQVIRGSGAFVETARNSSDFPRAIRRKLERELLQQMLGDGAAPAQSRG